MAVTFRPTQAQPDIDEEEIFETGDYLTDVILKIADLPRGFPVAAFAPFLLQGSYAIRADVVVERAKLLLRPSVLRSQPVVPEYRLSFVIFAKEGLPAIVPYFMDDTRGFVEIPGTLYPLPTEREIPHG